MDHVDVLSRFVETYQALNKTNLHLLDDIYTTDITFSDPLHTVTGLTELHAYFAALYENVNAIHFTIHESYITENKGFLYWEMNYAHPKFNQGKSITVSGHSALTFSGDKVSHHRDYFDVGEMMYQHLPLIGKVIRFINNKATSY